MSLKCRCGSRVGGVAGVPALSKLLPRVTR